MAFLYKSAEGIRNTLGSLSWGPLVSVTRSAIVDVLKRVKHGQLKLTYTDGSVEQFGQDTPDAGTPTAELQVSKDTFWVRMALFADMGFAESYMLGEISCANLTAFFELFIINKEELSNGTTIGSYVAGILTGLARKTNTLSNAQLNISAHYDISNDMFAAFLSDDMTYSCPVWRLTSDPKSATETLEQAQMTKIQRFIDAARIQPTDYVLEIGTGWGSLAIEAVRQTGCRVHSITLSKEQKDLADERIAKAGFSDKIKVELMDYRALAPPDEGLYNKVVSCEMLEAVGKEYLAMYFDCVNRVLEIDGGIGVFQCITIPDERYEDYAKTDDFIRRYIFPGGHLPCVSKLIDAINEGSVGQLIVENLENIGPHYAKTLRLWREKFLENFESQVVPALHKEHGDMSAADVEVFRRKWEYYFTYCEAGFRTNTLGDVIVTVTREGNKALMAGIPL